MTYKTVDGYFPFKVGDFLKARSIPRLYLNFSQTKLNFLDEKRMVIK